MSRKVGEIRKSTRPMAVLEAGSVSLIVRQLIPIPAFRPFFGRAKHSGGSDHPPNPGKLHFLHGCKISLPTIHQFSLAWRTAAKYLSLFAPPIALDFSFSDSLAVFPYRMFTKLKSHVRKWTFFFTPLSNGNSGFRLGFESNSPDTVYKMDRTSPSVQNVRDSRMKMCRW